MDRHLLQEVRRLGREAADDTSGLVQEKAVGGEFILFLVPVLAELVAELVAALQGQRLCHRATASRRCPPDLGDIRGAGKEAGRTPCSTAGR